jgi:hypothetical protein
LPAQPVTGDNKALISSQRHRSKPDETDAISLPVSDPTLLGQKRNGCHRGRRMMPSGVGQGLHELRNALDD